MKKLSPNVNQLIDNAIEKIQRYSPQQAWEKSQNGEAIIVDIRDIRELANTGKMVGAMHIPRGILEFNLDPENPAFNEEFKADKQIILYCATGGRSALSTKTLMDMGVDVVDIEGGIKSWMELKLPIEPLQ